MRTHLNEASRLVETLNLCVTIGELTPERGQELTDQLYVALGGLRRALTAEPRSDSRNTLIELIDDVRSNTLRLGRVSKAGDLTLARFLVFFSAVRFLLSWTAEWAEILEPAQHVLMRDAAPPARPGRPSLVVIQGGVR